MKRRGRPPLALDERSIAVHVRLSSSQYDRTYQQAQQARLTISEWIRQTLHGRIVSHNNRQ